MMILKTGKNNSVSVRDDIINNFIPDWKSRLKTLGQSSYFLSAVIFVITLAVFYRVLGSQFVMWDDNWCIYDNPAFGGLSFKNVYLIFTNATVSSSWYTPLTGLTWSLIYTFSGLNPLGYHLVDWLFHAANSVLLFHIIKELLSINLSEQKTKGIEKNKVLFAAVLATLFWSLHPLRVETVAWAACSYGQALFFMLLALLCYLYACLQKAVFLPRRWILTFSVVLYLASLLTQPVGLGLVLVLFIIDIYPFKRLHIGRQWSLSQNRSVLLEKLPFIIVAVIVVFVNIVIVVYLPGGPHKSVSLAEFGLFERIMQAFYILAYYIWRPWYPVHLSPVYTTLVSFQPMSMPFVISGLTVAGALTVLVWLRHRWPAGPAIGISYLVLMAPVMGWTDHPHFSSDRYSLIPSLCWSILLAVWLGRSKMDRLFRKTVYTVLIITIIFFGMLSFRQIRIWKNSTTLFESILYNLGDDPYRVSILWRLGDVLQRQGKLAGAVKYFRQALSIKPNNIKINCLLAKALEKEGRLDEAAGQYRRVLQLWPENIEALDGIGYVMLKLGKVDEAVMAWQKLLKLNPDSPRVHNMLGALMAERGDFDKAIYHYNEALRLEPGWYAPMSNLALIYASTNLGKFCNPSIAVRLAKRACELTDYKDPRVLAALAMAYAADKNYLQAVKIAEKALGLATAANNKKLAGEIESRLQLFRTLKLRDL